MLALFFISVLYSGAYVLGSHLSSLVSLPNFSPLALDARLSDISTQASKEGSLMSRISPLKPLAQHYLPL